MKGSRTLSKVKDLMTERNQLPYFLQGADCIKSGHETEIEILTEMWEAGTLGDKHQQWDSGNHEAFSIYSFDKPSLISRKGLDPGIKKKGLHYIESDKDYITCPQLFFGPDTYTLVSSYRGHGGLLIKLMMKAMDHFAKGRWTRDSETGDIKVDGTTFFSWISDGFGTDLSSYSLEISIFRAWVVPAELIAAFSTDWKDMADDLSGLLNLVPGLDLNDFFKYLYDNVEQLR